MANVLKFNLEMLLPTAPDDVGGPESYLCVSVLVTKDYLSSSNSSQTTFCFSQSLAVYSAHNMTVFRLVELVFVGPQ